MTSKTDKQEEQPAAVLEDQPVVSQAEQKRQDRSRENVRKAVQDENAGRGGSYVMEPGGTRKLIARTTPAKPKA